MAVLEQNQNTNPMVFLTCDDPFSGACVTKQAPSTYQMFADDLGHSAVRMAGDIIAADTIRNILEPVTVSGENGSELTIDDKNRISIFKDAAGRRFGFAYDEKTGQLNAFANEHGDWLRLRNDEGRYRDSWTCIGSGVTWNGSIAIGRSGCSMNNAAERVLFSPCGTKTVEKIAAGEVYSRIKEDAQGNVSIEDTVKQTISYKFVDGRSALRNLLNKSLLGYDAAGKLTVMYDADGRKFEFQNYAEDSQPTRIVNERGAWNRIGHQTWCNEETGRRWYGTVKVNDNGAYSYIDLSGKQTVRYCNGYLVEEYCGIRTITDSNGRRTRQFTDGKEFVEPPLVGRPKFVLRNGVTTDCKLILERGECSSVQSKADAYVSIRFESQSPVASFQDGVVVYSSRNADANDQRKHALISLSEKDLALIEKYRGLNSEQGVVVVQCYDRAHCAIRYQLYVGLEIVNVVSGDKVKAGQPIGRIGKSGKFTFAIRRNTVSGAPVQISAEGQISIADI